MTDTDSTLCLFEQDELTPSRLIYEAAVPAGATCGTRPCWNSGLERFRYRDALPSVNGLSPIKIDLALPQGTFPSTRHSPGISGL